MVLSAANKKTESTANVISENFIGVYENAYDSEYCKQVISWFEVANAAGLGKNRFEVNSIKKHQIDDVSVFFDDETLKFSLATKLSGHFLKLFWEKYYFDYSSKFSVLQDYAKHTIYKLKVQKTNPGGGYHVWHSENSGKAVVERIAAFTLYLNDIDDGGETEFLYYGLRIKPKQGTLVIWPAGYTHAHRGNPPLRETKYIVTGWIEFE